MLVRWANCLAFICFRQPKTDAVQQKPGALKCHFFMSLIFFLLLVLRWKGLPLCLAGIYRLLFGSVHWFQPSSGVSHFDVLPPSLLTFHQILLNYFKILGTIKTAEFLFLIFVIWLIDNSSKCQMDMTIIAIIRLLVKLSPQGLTLKDTLIAKSIANTLRDTKLHNENLKERRRAAPPLSRGSFPPHPPPGFWPKCFEKVKCLEGSLWGRWVIAL